MPHFEWKISPRRGDGNACNKFITSPRTEWKISPRRGDGNIAPLPAVIKYLSTKWKISPRRGDGNNYFSTGTTTIPEMEDKSPKRGRKFYLRFCVRHRPVSKKWKISSRRGDGNNVADCVAYTLPSNGR